MVYEGAHLSFEDITVDNLKNPQWLQVRIKASKMDPFCDIFVGRTNDLLCPVAAVLGYMMKWGSRPGPLFLFMDGKPLTWGRFVAKVKDALSEAGVDSSCYSGHSLKSGAATTAAKRGIGDTTISAYQVYIERSWHKYQNVWLTHS